MFIRLSNSKFFLKVCTRRNWTAGACLDEIRNIIDGQGSGAGCGILSTVRAAVYRFIEDKRITREIVEKRKRRARA